MKNILKILFLLFFPLLFLTGCAQKNENEPFVVFSNQPVNQKTVPQRSFKSGERVYFAAIDPNGFDDEVIRIQIFKKDEKSEFLGYSYHSNKDYKLTEEHYYLDYFVIHTPGHYIMQVFEITNLQKPVILGDFWIGDR